MQPRQLLIVLAAAVLAFAATFGIAQAGGGEEQPAAKAAPKPQPAEVIEVDDATVSNGVAAAAGLPPLQVPEKTPEAPDTPSSPSPAPSTPAPSSPAPSSPAPSSPAPSSPAPAPSNPAPAPSNPEPQGPISTGGGED